MKCVLKLIGKFYCITAVVFMPLVLLFTAVGSNIAMSNSVFSTMLVLLAFSCFISLDFILCTAIKINVIIKRIIHFVLAYGAFLLSFFVFPKKLGDLYALVVMTLVFVLLYAIVGGIKIAITAFIDKKTEDQTYINVYDNLGVNKK